MKFEFIPFGRMALIFSSSTCSWLYPPPACKLASVKSWPGYDIFGPLAKFASPTSGRKNRTWAWTSMNIYHINLGLSCCFQIICRKYETLYIAFWFEFPISSAWRICSSVSLSFWRHQSNNNPFLSGIWWHGRLKIVKHVPTCLFCSLSTQGLPFV